MSTEIRSIYFIYSLCLRQKSEVDHLEKLRVEEWKLDVPTIGNVYRAAANIVRYFNGLGFGSL